MLIPIDVVRQAAVAVVVLAFGCREPTRPPEPKPVPAVAKVDAAPPAKPKPKTSNGIGSPLPEVGPHPDYPTPVRAGTDQIFLLEEPDRGQKAPLAFALPPRDSLVWTQHAYCKDDKLSVICSPKPAAPQELFRWRVGRKAKALVVAERLRGTQVDETYVYIATPEGKPVQRLYLDSHARVGSALLFATSQHQYSGRKRNGGNALAGCGFESYKLDANGRIAETGCLQWIGEPMTDIDGVAIERFVRDAQGFVIEARGFGIDGEPVNDLGPHLTLYELDEHGRTVVERYRDASDKPVRNRDGCHGTRTERDVRGATIKTICLDGKDAVVADFAGTSTRSYRVDERGCRIADRLFNQFGNAALSRTNVHGHDYEVDARCATTSKTCVSIAERPMTCSKSEPARYVYTLDATGKIVSAKHYDATGTPATDAEYHVFERASVWDDLGNQIARSCHDPKGAAVECSKTGFHAERISYDDAGRATETRYYGTSGGPATNQGTAIRRFRYDNYDHRVEGRSYDAAGALVESRGMTIRRELYDAAHRAFAIVLLDRAGNPASYTSCYAGATCPEAAWHAVRIVRRADGSIEKNQFFDAAGQLIHVNDCRAKRCFD